MQTKLLLLPACTALGTGNTSWPRFPHLQIGTCDHFPALLEARIRRRAKWSCPPSTSKRQRVSLFLPRLSKGRRGSDAMVCGEGKGLVPGSGAPGTCS